MNQTNTDTDFHAVLHRFHGEGEHATFEIPAGWAQGRATFGGLVAALLVRAMRSHVDPERRLRSVMFSMAGPVEPGRVHVEVHRVREGRTVTHLEARAVQNGEDRCVCLAMFGIDNASSLAVAPPPAPTVPGPDEALALPFVPGLTPEFTRHFEYRFAIGGMPFSGSTDRSMGGWCRFSEAGGEVDDEALLALVDAWPPAILPMLNGPTNSSTATWSMDFLPRPKAADIGAWWLYRAQVEAAGHGAATTTAVMWDPDGNPVAVSRQSVAYFEP